jgi:hypothetical protein
MTTQSGTPPIESTPTKSGTTTRSSAALGSPNNHLMETPPNTLHLLSPDLIDTNGTPLSKSKHVEEKIQTPPHLLSVTWYERMQSETWKTLANCGSKGHIRPKRTMLLVVDPNERSIAKSFMCSDEKQPCDISLTKMEATWQAAQLEQVQTQTQQADTQEKERLAVEQIRAEIAAENSKSISNLVMRQLSGFGQVLNDLTQNQVVMNRKLEELPKRQEGIPEPVTPQARPQTNPKFSYNKKDNGPNSRNHQGTPSKKKAERWEPNRYRNRVDRYVPDERERRERDKSPPPPRNRYLKERDEPLPYRSRDRWYDQENTLTNTNAHASDRRTERTTQPVQKPKDDLSDVLKSISKRLEKVEHTPKKRTRRTREQGRVQQPMSAHQQPMSVHQTSAPVVYAYPNQMPQAPMYPYPYPPPQQGWAGNRQF